MLHRVINYASSYSFCFSETALTFAAHRRATAVRGLTAVKSLFSLHVCLPLKTWRIAGGGNRVGLLLASALVKIVLIPSHVNTICYDMTKIFALS
jgi:hypothetical protein